MVGLLIICNFCNSFGIRESGLFKYFRQIILSKPRIFRGFPSQILNTSFKLIFPYEKPVYILFLFLLSGMGIFAQVCINVDNTPPDPSAGLDVKFSNKGVLLPRMTRAERNAIGDAAEGLMVYCTNCGTHGALSIFTNKLWMTFSPCVIESPVAGTHIMSEGQIVWNWSPVAGALGYKWNFSSDYETASDIGVTYSFTETGTVCNRKYRRYIWAYTSCGESAVTSLSTTVPVSVPATPVAATHVSTQSSILWKWHPVTGSTGYKWSSTNNVTTAVDIGTDTTKYESALTCGVEYERFAWAYNGCGYSVPVTLLQSTLYWCTCGDLLTINHVEGSVAPVTKTVTYGTVANLPGELSRCWITSNLGSDHQASAVNDASEASAGWYWQFNLKQGYKHDGSTITPQTSWIDAITESLDWQTVNDPCSIELGAGWRIPTHTEWSNLNGYYGWINWDGPWGSTLKIHAAGHLESSDGSLLNCGIKGTYWSTTQFSANSGWNLNFSQSISAMYYDSKAFGMPLRCLRE